MAVKVVGIQDIFETEVHSGFYRGTILIELDRVGEKSPGDLLNSNFLPKKNKTFNGSINCYKTYGWWEDRAALTDISPKYVCAALMTVKNPILWRQ